MPIEPLGITASVIAVVQLTYGTCESLSETLRAIKNVPEELENLQNDLTSFQAILESYGEASFSDLEDVGLSADQRASLKALVTVMEGCQMVCEKFEGKLCHLTSHSDENHLALLDRVRLHFNNGEIGLLKENLAQGQRTLTDALGFANLYVFPMTCAGAQFRTQS